MEVEDELALLPQDEVEGAAVPDLDGARAVPRGDHAVEVHVLDRMVLHLDRQATHAGLLGRPLGDGPALQHAVQLEPEVVVEVAGVVLLDDEARAPRLGNLTLRLRALLEVPLLLILLQPHVLVASCAASAASSLANADRRGVLPAYQAAVRSQVGGS